MVINCSKVGLLITNYIFATMLHMTKLFEPLIISKSEQSIRKKIKREEPQIFRKTRYLGLLLILVLAFHQEVNAQTELSWDDLADVTYDEQFDEEIDGYWLLPNFGDQIKSHQNKEVSLEGYLLLLDFDNEVVVLSKNTYSACFFCGAAGPESIVELQLKQAAKGIKMDQRAKVTGKLILNRDDFDHFNYILKDAVIKIKE